MLACELLNVAYDFRHIAVSHGLGHIFELGCCLADVVTCLRDIGVKFVSRAANDARDIADIVGSGGLLFLKSGAQLLTGVRRDVLGGVPSNFLAGF